MVLCLGRLPKKGNEKSPLLRVMLSQAKISLPVPPVSTTWRSQVKNWPMLGNDSVGNCVIAGSLHYYQSVTANANIQIIPDTASAISDYSLVGEATAGSGYDPTTGANDNGLVIDEAVTYWMDKGLAIDSNGILNKLAGQARIEPTDHEVLKVGISEFCGVLAGVNLPTSAQAETNSGVPWESLKDVPGSWGGHCIYIVDYDENWLYTITWGAVQKLSWAWWDKYSDEAVAILDRDWISSKTKTSPSKLTLASLDKEIEELRGTLGVSAYG